jgi:hypothetical protein
MPCRKCVPVIVHVWRLGKFEFTYQELMYALLLCPKRTTIQPHVSLISNPAEKTFMQVSSCLLLKYNSGMATCMFPNFPLSLSMSALPGSQLYLLYVSKNPSLPLYIFKIRTCHRPYRLPLSKVDQRDFMFAGSSASKKQRYAACRPLFPKGDSNLACGGYATGFGHVGFAGLFQNPFQQPHVSKT